MTFHTVRRALMSLFSRLFTGRTSGRAVDRGSMSPQWVAAQRAARQDR
jgi:hypothetical protein